MKALRACLHLACATLLAGAAGAAIPTLHPALLLAQPPLLAQFQPDQPSVQLDETLFVQAPEQDNGTGAIVLLWLPQPLQKLCLGKTITQCSAIDYCIQTTNPGTARCRNLGVNLAHIPPYAPGMRPPHALSDTLSRLEPTKFAQLQDFYKTAPKASLQRISMSARIRARIRFTEDPNFYRFDLVEVLAVPPF